MAMPTFCESDTDINADTHMVDKMLEKGIVSLKADGSFSPEENITKDDFLRMVAKLFRQEGDPVTVLVEKNIVSADFAELNPEADVIRERAANILYKAFIFAYEFEPQEAMAADDFSSVSGCAQKAVSVMCALGFMDTYNGYFKPSQPLTRKEAAEAAYRMFYTDETYTCKNGPGAYMNDELAEEVRAAYARGARKVTVQPGVYYLYNPSKTSYARASHFALEYMNDFTLEGYNVKLIGCTPSDGTDGTNMDLTMMLVTFCEDITVRGFTTDYIHPIFTQGKVVDVYETADHACYVVFEIDEGYPNMLDDRTYFGSSVACYLYDPHTAELRPGVSTLNLSPVKAEGYERRWVCRNWAPQTQKFFRVGDLIAMRMTKCAPMNTRFGDCRNVTIEDYTIQSGNFGLLIEPTLKRENGESDNTVVRNVKVTYGDRPEGAARDRLMSSTADAIHLSYLSGKILVENCIAEGNTDDTYALNGRHYIVSEQGPNEDQYYIGTPYYGRALAVGDTMAVYDEMSNLKGTVKIKTLDEVTESYEPPEDAKTIASNTMGQWFLITFENSQIIQRLNYMMDTDASSGKFIIRNCVGRNTKGRGILAQCWNGLIENCEFDKCALGGISLEGEKHCAQGPYAKDIVVRSCRITSCGYSADNSTGLFNPHPAFNTEINESGRANENIVVDSCYFDNNYGHDIALGNTKNAVITNNVFGTRNAFTEGRLYPGVSSVRVINCEDVYFDDSNTALTERTLLTYQDVDRFNTDVKCIYSAEFLLDTVNEEGNEWSYQYAPVDTNDYKYYNYQYWREGTWVAISPLWSQDKADNSVYGCIQSRTEVMPGSENDFVATYTAPYDGRVKVVFNNGLYIKEGKYNSNGVKVKILKNEKDALWPQTGWRFIKYGEPLDYIEDIYTEVKKGDKIRFRINANGSTAITSDVVMFSPEIEYVRLDTEQYEEHNNSFMLSEQYTELILESNDTVQLTAVNSGNNTPIIWSSSREDVAVVEADGTVRAVGPGVTIILAVCNNMQAECIIAVGNAEKIMSAHVSQG